MALPDLFPFEKLVPVCTALEITGCSQYFPHTKPHGNLPVLQHLKKVFPGIFKGALEGRARQITEDMKLAAALAIANLVPDDEVSDVNILPEAFDPRVADVVSKAVIDHIEK